ncbi:hypothetical protein JCM19236_2214 [Vibrio sp. JCM 19236]|nr:hypothetical protein JCM19236_2214 [Vibrio sp. JCM 19236]
MSLVENLFIIMALILISCFFPCQKSRWPQREKFACAS